MEVVIALPKPRAEHMAEAEVAWDMLHDAAERGAPADMIARHRQVALTQLWLYPLVEARMGAPA